MSSVKNNLKCNFSLCTCLSWQMNIKIIPIYRVATVNWLWNSRTFPELFRTSFQANSRTFCTKKALLFCILNQQWVLQFLGSLLFLFSYIVTSKCLVVKTAHFDYYLQLKVKNLAHSRISRDHNPNSRIFQGPAKFQTRILFPCYL